MEAAESSRAHLNVVTLIPLFLVQAPPFAVTFFCQASKIGKVTMTKRKGVIDKQDAEREAILDERETLRRQFPASYSPDVGVFSDGKVEIMFKLTYAQAEKLARLLREHKE